MLELSIWTVILELSIWTVLAGALLCFVWGLIAGWKLQERVEHREYSSIKPKQVAIFLCVVTLVIVLMALVIALSAT